MKYILFSFFLFITALPATLSADETITLAIGEWAPYTSEKDMNGKLSEVIVSEAFQLVGILVTFEYYPWQRSYKMTTRGEVTGTFPWFHHDKRQNETIYNKEPLVTETEVIFHLTSLDFQWDDYTDLKPYRVGGTIGYNHNLILAEHGIKTAQVKSDLLNFKKLLNHRIDLFPVSYNVGYYIINKFFEPGLVEKFTTQPKPIQEGELFILFSRSIPNGQILADRFDQGLRKLKGSGQYDQILKEFIGH